MVSLILLCKKTLLIFTNDGFRQADVENCARQMYPIYSQYDIPTWIVADPDQQSNEQDAPIIVMQVRPERKPVSLTTPREFNEILEKLDKEHCLYHKI